MFNFRKFLPRARTTDAATASLFRVETRPNGDWALVLKNPLRTTDARKHPMVYRRPTGDVVLTADPQPRNPDMFGHLTWQGDLRPLGKAVGAVMFELARIKDKARQKDALSKAVRDIASFGNELGNGSSTGTMRHSGFHSLGTGTDERPEEFNLGSGAEPADVNGANRVYWDKANKSVTRDSPRPTPRGSSTTSADINANNAAFWKG